MDIKPTGVDSLAPHKMLIRLTSLDAFRTTDTSWQVPTSIQKQLGMQLLELEKMERYQEIICRGSCVRFGKFQESTTTGVWAIGTLVMPGIKTRLASPWITSSRHGLSANIGAS